MSSNPLSKRVLVTRPKHQQDHFLELCNQAGLETVSLPCIDILPVECNISAAKVSTAELIIFTSRNAVDFAHKILPLPWAQANVYAIGRATERALAKLGQTLIHPPIEPYNSEAFLDWYAAQPPSKSVLIIKGLNGRNLIESTLKKSNVDITVKAVYKRVIPVVSDAERQRIFVETPANIISVTSDDVLRNLINIAGPTYAHELHATQLVVNSERCAAMAAKLGFDHAAKVADPPGDEGQLTAIIDCMRVEP